MASPITMRTCISVVSPPLRPLPMSPRSTGTRCPGRCWPVSVERNKLGARVIPYTPASRPGRGCWQIWGNSFQIFFRYFNHPIQIAGLTEAGQTAAWFWFHGQLKNDARLLAQCGHKTTHHGEHSGRSFYK